MDFLNHREGGNGFLSGFPPLSFTEIVRGCVILKQEKSQAKLITLCVLIIAQFTPQWTHSIVCTVYTCTEYIVF
jgi:hypothetical protein